MLKDKKYYLFDIDGTIAVDTTLLKGTRELLLHIEAAGGRAFYITNNSSKSRQDYVEKFRNWNIQTEVSQFITASYATAVFLREHYAGKLLYIVGTKSFVAELESFGLDITETYQEDAAAVVVGFDQELVYDKIADACRLLVNKDVDYIATNPDLRCPTGFGFIPDCGSICRMIECAVERTPYYVGKPNPAIVDMCLNQTGGRREEAIVVGDRLYTDIACGINGKVETAVVFTGEAAREDMADTEYPADYEFDSVWELYETAAGKREEKRVCR